MTRNLTVRGISRQRPGCCSPAAAPGVCAESRAAFSRSSIGTARRACRSTRRRPTRRWGRSWASSTISSCTSRTSRRTACIPSSPISPKAGPGARTAPELTFKLRPGVKWHDGKPFTATDVKCTWDLLMGKGSDKLRLNPRKAWYLNVDRVDRQRRFRGDLPSETAAAGLARAAGLGLFAGLSLPLCRPRDAPASDRHRPLQVRRVQAQRAHQGGAQPGLLEAGPALSRRHRLHHRAEPLDRDPRLYRRAIRHDLAVLLSPCRS